jgi:Cys-rich repeat protein
MISHRIFRGSLAGLLLAGALFEAGSAAADSSCTQNSDCSKGFSCQVIGGTACPGYACPAEIDGGQACAPPPACTPQTIMGCEPGPCNTDSDCAAGMVCNADSYETCAAPPAEPKCPANADCGPAPAVDAGACTTTVVKTCVPRYDLPCTVSSDCGDGFTCVPDTETVCSAAGSAGSGSAGSGSGSGSGSGTVSPPPSPPAMTSPPAAPVDASTEPPSCTTTTLPTSSCQVNTISCVTDTDCPSTWTCAAQSVAVSNVCVGPAQTVGEDAAPQPVCTGGSSPPAQMQCEPPYYNGPGVGFANGSSTAGGAVPVADPQGTDPQGTASGSNGGATAASGSASAPKDVTGGCAVGSPGTRAPGGASLLLVLGLGALGRLARRREGRE